MAPLVHTISEACSCACIGRTSLYNAINSGALRAVKRGARTLILDDDLRNWLQSLPAVSAKPPRTEMKSRGVTAKPSAPDAPSAKRGAQ